MKYTKVFMVGITIGVAVAMVLAGIMYGIRANEPENKLTFQKAVEKTILCGIYFGITCGLLYILAKDYGYNLELLILSAILLAGILASIGTSIPWQSLIGIGIVVISVFIKWIYLLIKRNREESVRKQDGYEMIPMNNPENFKTN
jgi:NADH:ubiquinone oxidoreductase subunit 6 (subunit J)